MARIWKLEALARGLYSISVGRQKSIIDKGNSSHTKKESIDHSKLPTVFIDQNDGVLKLV